MAQVVKHAVTPPAAANKMLAALAKVYPDAHCSLTFKTPFQLLIATILSAQCTDERVNKVTPTLFKKYPDASSMSQAPLSDLEDLIRSTGFFKNKARSLQETSRALVEKHGGKVPRTMEELVLLRGIGRKTANVVLGNAYGIAEGIAVDTHVGRLSRRMGITKEHDPVKVERTLMEIVPQKNWNLVTHWLIDHGRAVCDARKPDCSHCPIRKSCPKILK